ncbi:hypothetical protein TNCV_240721 [Trichonephila clavipes]|nr:hypothetical protein TNCV_240721 [Trichonephila clavipes]
MFCGNNGRVLFYCDSPDLSDTPDQRNLQVSLTESEVPNKSGSEITPRQEFRLLCGNTVTGLLRNDFARRKDLVCKADVVSISRSPERKRLTDFGSPPQEPFV